MKRTSLSARLLCRGIVAGAILTVCSLQASDATDPTTQGAGAAKLVSTDAATFIKEANQANVAEIAFATLANRKSQNAEVKEFATVIRRDHREANEKLRPVALAHGVTMSDSLDAAHQKKLAKLQELSGTEFDQEFAKIMLVGHQAAIQKFEKAAQESQDQDIKEYAENTLTTLRQHMNHAKDTAKAVGIDQETIASLLKESADAAGGTVDNSQKESGGHNQPDSGTKPDERPPDQNK